MNKLNPYAVLQSAAEIEQEQESTRLSRIQILCEDGAFNTLSSLGAGAVVSSSEQCKYVIAMLLLQLDSSLQLALDSHNVIMLSISGVSIATMGSLQLLLNKTEAK